MGATGMLDVDPSLDTEWNPWTAGFLFSPALTVGGGTSEVLRNIIAERLLGLPHDIDVEQGKTFAETGGNVAARWLTPDSVCAHSRSASVTAQ